ncbi:uncharacterized protein CTHT_0056660 [Thermochaetoides thermophila DSM 1495]|uniref:PWI domain-containing protein n=1 Tax=Chaetomium thermophilum (strain DSM 1495 / CBS 144.50 / IMI 039719) TaxID=759272 RepID=G0SCB8_CHATD|nr:hypothetical protein CTHT_0056660 [Thermochaetoides thermophila DSM 1495]EGS19044.1 hypothetical protein CTHT_0056660 [Thermochaetoides thermophila DSM 1495]
MATATGVDLKLLKSTKFPPEFNQKVDMSKVNIQVMKKWIANKVTEILGQEDDVVIELIFNLIEGTRNPDIKALQIQLTGFLDKDTPAFCKELWKLLLSAQNSPQGVPKELLEAKKLELMQEKTRPQRKPASAEKNSSAATVVKEDVVVDLVEVIHGAVVAPGLVPLPVSASAAVEAVAAGEKQETHTSPAGAMTGTGAGGLAADLALVRPLDPAPVPVPVPAPSPLAQHPARAAPASMAAAVLEPVPQPRRPVAVEGLAPARRPLVGTQPSDAARRLVVPAAAHTRPIGHRPRPSADATRLLGAEAAVVQGATVAACAAVPVVAVAVAVAVAA